MLYVVDLINVICVSNEESILLSSLVFIRQGLPKSPRVQTRTLFKLCSTKDVLSVLCSVVRLSMYGGMKSHGWGSSGRHSLEGFIRRQHTSTG